MTDYIGITEAQTNPFAPLTSELVKQLRDNPLAITEGDDTAPRIATVAIAGFLARASGLGFDGTVLTNIDPRARLLVQGGNTGSGTIRFRLSSDNGDTWTAWSNDDGLTTPTPIFLINMSNGQYTASNRVGTLSGSDFNTINIASTTSSGGFFEAMTVNRGA